MPRSSCAISLTAPTRRAISFRVNPSGKTMRRISFGGAVSVAPVDGSSEAELPPSPTPMPKAAQPMAATRPKPTTTPKSAPSLLPRRLLR